MGTLRWLPIRCYFHWLMSLFLRSLLLQDWYYFICLACTTAKIFYSPSQICCGKSGTNSRYSGFCERFWFLLFAWPAQWPIFTTVGSLFPTNMMPSKIPKNDVHVKTTKCMPISSFCWLLSYWLLLSLKDTNNEALFLHF